jgi:hypothetical protein
MAMAMKEELEFMTVGQDEDDGAMNTAYGGSSNSGLSSVDDNDQVIGSWFKTSKVSLCSYYI